jgi:hypothetical protein
VRRCRRDDDGVAGPPRALAAGDPKDGTARDDLDALFLARMDVLGGDEAARLEDEVDPKQLAAGYPPRSRGTSTARA